MRLLILTAFYPIPGVTHERMFVHVRNQYYQIHGAEVTVLNFAAKENYIIDNIQVITLQEFEKKNVKYDIAISHSANIRNHYKFLKRYESKFEKLVFFFHGHEASIFAKDYPKPYSFTSEGKLSKRIFQYIYDIFKLTMWRSFYKSLASKSQFIFVSEHFYKRVQKNMRILPKELQNHCHVIPNSIGSFFEDMDYIIESKKSFDFITIRSNLDASTYSIDLLMGLANKYPNKRFLLIGKGKFFKYFNLPSNVVWINNTLNHEEMLCYLNNSKCGIMLTRSDTQGVMTCEMASIGMPVISSDIDVCHEILGKMPNVALVPNDIDKIDLDAVYTKLASGLPYKKDKTYFAEKTIQTELYLFKSILNISF